MKIKLAHLHLSTYVNGLSSSLVYGVLFITEMRDTHFAKEQIEKAVTEISRTVKTSFSFTIDLDSTLISRSIVHGLRTSCIETGVVRLFSTQTFPFHKEPACPNLMSLHASTAPP